MRFIAALLIAASTAGATVTAQEGTVYVPGDGVSPPVAVTTVKPDYTEEAKAARIEGTLRLETVVLPDGNVGEVRVVQSLDASLGLDDQGVSAMKQWAFKPGEKDRRPVAVRVLVEMIFSLK